MIAACLVIFSMEIYAVLALFRKYRSPNEDDLTNEDFLSRCSLEDLIKLRYHVNSVWLALGMMTMGTLLKCQLGVE